MRVRTASGEAGPTDGPPDAEEPVDRGLPADDPERGLSGPPDDVAGDDDHLADEAPELHGYVSSAILDQMREHREPAFQVPRERRDDHVGPVGFQVVERHPHRVHPALELGDEVFLVAALVGFPDDRGCAQVRACRDIVAVAQLVEEGQLALHPGDVLSHDDQAVRLLARRRTVGELGDVFVVEPQVVVAALDDDPLLLVRTLLAPLAGPGRPARSAFKCPPCIVIQHFHGRRQRLATPDAEDEVHLPAPTVELRGQRKMRIPTQAPDRHAAPPDRPPGRSTPPHPCDSGGCPAG